MLDSFEAFLWLLVLMLHPLNYGPQTLYLQLIWCQTLKRFLLIHGIQDEAAGRPWSSMGKSDILLSRLLRTCIVIEIGLRLL
jgi:hypothetical protein